MGWSDVSAAVLGRVTWRLDQLAASRARSRLDYVAAGVILGVSALLVEVYLASHGHGAHLLIFLLIVMVASFRIGPAPAAIALGIGAVGSAVGSVAELGPSNPMPQAIAELLLYLLAGTVYLALLSGAVRARQRPVTGPSQPVTPRPSLTEDLTTRELQILRLAASGLSTDEIGRSLYLSSNTVKTHLSHAYQKLGAHSRSDAVRAAIHCGCLTSGDICPHHPVSPGRDTSNG